MSTQLDAMTLRLLADALVLLGDLQGKIGGMKLAALLLLALSGCAAHWDGPTAGHWQVQFATDTCGTVTLDADVADATNVSVSDHDTGIAYDCRSHASTDGSEITLQCGYAQLNQSGPNLDMLLDDGGAAYSAFLSAWHSEDSSCNATTLGTITVTDRQR